MDGQCCEELVRIHLQELSELVQRCDYCLGISTNATLKILSLPGDMNYVYRVHVIYTCCDYPAESRFSVVVKMAPDNVLYLKDDEKIPVDPRKIEHEHAMLCKLNDLCHQSVPMVYILDIHRNAIIMEDMQDYKKLTDYLAYGDLEDRNIISAIEKAVCFIGHVHRETNLAEKTVDERILLKDKFGNPSMRLLMSQLLFDKPFDPEDTTNRWNPKLLTAIDSIRKDDAVKDKVEITKKAFLGQDDCLCHGDFATDNVLVNSSSFRVIDLEFSGIGLRAYDLALFLQMILFQLICQLHKNNQATARSLLEMVHVALKGYTQEVGRREMTEDPTFVDQVCSLIGCEFMWIVFGSYTLEEFSNCEEPEQKLLSLAKLFLLESDVNQSITWNINEHLVKIYGASYIPQMT